MSASGIEGLRFRLPKRRIAELVVVAAIMALLTLFIGDLPELEVVESTVNDDSFTDLIITTRGELPIDTGIVVMTYGPESLDEEGWVDREVLAMRLLLLFELKPKVVAVDYLLEELRPEKPLGDEMMKGLIADHRDDLIIGVFREDSLDRFRMPPGAFAIDTAQLGAVNHEPGEDRVIRTFQTDWSTTSGSRFPSLALRIAEKYSPNDAAYLHRFDAERFVIDYAGGIGEHEPLPGDPAIQVFPSWSLQTMMTALETDDTATLDFFREKIAGKAVLVGYADIRPGQVTSIVDRFYTPLKPEKNSLPDMHGVAIHANILNTILQRRIVFEVPWWANVIWGTVIVFAMYYGVEMLRAVRPARRRTFLMYLGWAALLAIGLLLPVTLFRFSPYKLSVYTPFAGLLLGRPLLVLYDRLKRIFADLRRRRKLKTALPSSLRRQLGGILATSDPRERYVRGLHVLQRLFHDAADRFLLECRAGGMSVPRETIAAPTTGRMSHAIERIDTTRVSPRAAVAIACIERIGQDHYLRRAMRVARSLVIAVNEINRQSAHLESEDRADGLSLPSNEATQVDADATDMVMAVVDGQETHDDDYRRADEMFDRLYALARGLGEEMDEVRTPAEGDAERADHPFVLHETCLFHDRPETFFYLSEQEDANNKDDYYDLIYIGETIRCRPQRHPGLQEFRAMTASITDKSVGVEGADKEEEKERGRGEGPQPDQNTQMPEM